MLHYFSPIQPPSFLQEDIGRIFSLIHSVSYHEKMKKRKLEVVVISDIHLGTYGCHAGELISYLKSIQPEVLILNGDIIDIWQFNKSYWPESHMQVIKVLTGFLAQGVKVYYITGNHDEMLRKFVGFKMGSLEIVNKVVLSLDGKKTWIFHGDVFDVTMQNSKWLAKLGAKGYDTLILINRMFNYISQRMGRGKLSLSKKIKNSVKSAVKFINDFEQIQPKSQFPMDINSSSVGTSINLKLKR